MYTGGDGYTAFTGGTDVLQPGDGLLEVAIEYVADNSPVAPVVEGRVTGPDGTGPACSSVRVHRAEGRRDRIVGEGHY